MSQQQGDGSERRQEPRARTSLVASLNGEGLDVPVVIHDVSTTGVLIGTSEPLPLGARCGLAFTAFGRPYSANLEVVREVNDPAERLYGCRLLLPELAAVRLSQAVRAVLGVASTWVRNWDEIQHEVSQPIDGNMVLVGQTPSGKPIELSASDCLEMGPDGIELFVRTVGDIETM